MNRLKRGAIKRWSVFERATPRLARFWFLVCLGFCLGSDFFLARVLLPNADSVQSYNEMLAVRGGNLLLRHWVTVTDNFVFTDLAAFILAGFAFGTGPRLIFLVPFLVFAGLILACLLLVLALAAGPGERLLGGYAVLLLLGEPYGMYYNFFFWSDFHVATVMFCLFAIWLVAPVLSGGHFNRPRLIPFTILIFMMAFSDPLAGPLLLAPLLLLMLLRAWLAGQFRLDDTLAAGCVLLAGGVSILARRGVAWAGGFTTSADVTGTFVSGLKRAGYDAHALLTGAQMLFTAKRRLLHGLPFPHLIVDLRLLTAAIVVALCATIVWRVPRDRAAGVAQLLVLGAGCLAVLEVLSRSFSVSISPGADFPGAATRFSLPLLVFLCVAAILRGQAVFALLGPRQRRAVAAFGVCLALVQAVGGAAAARAALLSPPGIKVAQQRLLVEWLLAHGLHYGVGDYWDTQMVQALSQGAVTADPALQLPSNQILLYPWATDTSRFGHAVPPQFVIIRPGSPFRIDLAGIAKTYGRPADVTPVAGCCFIARMP